MPIFAGFILFSILISADDDFEDEEKKEMKEEKRKSVHEKNCQKNR